MFAIAGNLTELLLVVIIIVACFGCSLLAVAQSGVEDKFNAELTEAEADLVEAEAKEAQRRTEMIEARAELEKAKAEAEAVRSTTDELVKHSRLNRRLLSWYAIRSNLFTALSIANLAMWGIGFYLHWRQR
jgi:uncharacterized membrane protein YqiK